jgi:hypothetical protein
MISWKSLEPQTESFLSGRDDEEFSGCTLVHGGGQKAKSTKFIHKSMHMTQISTLKGTGLTEGASGPD